MKLLSVLLIPLFLVSIAQPALGASPVFTTTLLLGSSGPEVLLLQQLLNREPATRIATTGVGSPGNETSHFGLLTKAAVLRFQEKYTNEVLAPAGLTKGTGVVGLYTRAKLNVLSSPVSGLPATPLTTTPSATSTPKPTATEVDPEEYVVKESEKIDIYAGDKMIAAVQKKILDALNTVITSSSEMTFAIPPTKPTDVPSVTIQMISPKSGLPGTKISIVGTGILANSAIYFGNERIVRSIARDLSGNFSVIIPPTAPKRYDVAIKTGASISNTMPFVVIDPRNPAVRIESVTPATISFGEQVTIKGSGFTAQNNTVVTTYQTITGVSSPDGKTLVIELTPDVLKEPARIGDKTGKVPMSISIINDYGFSNADKMTIMTI